jgi:beta-mannanase
MHEMNGNWYPWGGGDPAVYRAAWVHVCDLFAERGVTNVRWVWCPLVDDVAGPFEPYYPGHRYVDVLGLDGYNWGASEPGYGGWRTPAQVFTQAHERLVAVGHRQPVWIPEVGCAPDGDKAAWVSDFYRLMRKLERVKAVVWFSLDKERDWRVEADPMVAATLKRYGAVPPWPRSSPEAE